MTKAVTRLLGAALVGLVVLIGTSAQAADETAPGSASITHVESDAKGLQLLVSVPPRSDVDLEDVSVTIDGFEAEATATDTDADVSVERTAILVIDTSNSMKGERFAAAKSAALTFLDTVPDDVNVGIVTFADDVTRALPPTTDREAARDVLADLTLSPDTRLYDGVQAAVDMAGKDGQRTVLVLSDGRDTSDTSLEDVATGVSGAQVLLDVVSVDRDGEQDQALQALATAGSGRVITADAGALEKEFAKEAEILSRQVVVSAKVPDTIDSREATVEVTLQATPTALTAEAFATVRTSREDEGAQQDQAAPVASTTGSVALPPSWMYAGVGALGLGLLGLLVLLVPRPAPQLTPGERAAIYTDRVVGRHVGPARPEHDHTLDQAKDAAAKVLERNKTLEARIARRLEAAGSSLKPAEWLLVHAGVFLGAGAVGLLLGKGSFLIALLFLVFGALGPWIYLGVRRSRRRKAFSTSLPDTLQLMSGSLAAGLSLAQSVDTIVREGTEPISSEFKRVLVEMRLGVSLEDALQDVAERYDSKDFGWVVMAIKIQRQVGGNLAELLETVAATMREREYMRRQVSALAAEGKLSAWVLGGLPPVFMLYLLITNRDYVSVMVTDPIGWLMLGGAALLLGVGVFWMSRLVKVEV
jgi:tight adherence protein B